MKRKTFASALAGIVLSLLSISAIQAQDIAYPTVDTTIVLDGSTAAITGAGATVENGLITITAAGTYSLSGTLADGQIRVDTDDEGPVNLILNGVMLSSSTSAPIYIKEAESVAIILADGSENTVSDAAEYVYENADDDEPNAAVFSDDAFTIYGGGTLTVDANFNDGIASKDTLTIADAVLTVDAPDDGIRGKDSLVINGAEINVTAGGDGLKSDNEEDAALGFIEIGSGVFTIQAGGDAVQAFTTLTIADGEFNLVSGGGSTSAIAEDESAKGLKADGGVVINGGTFTINAADDGVHSNGTVTVNAGTLSIASGDDAMHADSALQINGGVINITASYEGIESAVITLNGGDIRLVSSDDGLNASNGNVLLSINGGTIVLDAGGDGLDANGTMEMTGGVVIVNGPTENMNGAVDYDGQFAMAGGFLVAAGSSGMSQAPSATSSQNSLLLNFTSMLPAGTIVRVESSTGEEILTFAPTKAFQSIVFSSPNLIMGETYTVYTGGQSDGTSADGLYTAGTYTGGTAYTTVTISGSVTQVGESSRGGGRGRR